jgi:hypothetical protein
MHIIYFVGSTATVCLVQDNYMLHIGHVGDSRAILCRENTVQTPDNNPSLHWYERLAGSSFTKLIRQQYNRCDISIYRK